MPDQEAVFKAPAQFRLLVGILVKLTSGVQSAFAEKKQKQSHLYFLRFFQVGIYLIDIH